MNDVCNSFSTVSIRGPCYNIYVECIAKKGVFDMYTVRFQLELSGSEKRFFVEIFSYYETRKKSILVNIELYNVDEYK